MSLTLTKISETSTTITLGWDPPQGIGGYVFYANGQAVSVASANNKDGSPRREIKYSKTSPGPPFIVAATCRQGGILVLQTGMYPTVPDPEPEPEPTPTGTRFAVQCWGFEASAMAQLGVKHSRSGDTAPSISVAALAASLQQYQSVGIRPWVLFNTNSMDTNMNELPGNLQALAAALGKGGTQAHPTLAPEWFEIGNEQLYSYSPKPGWDYAGEYTKGWLRARAAVKAGNPNVKVGFTLDTDGHGRYEDMVALIYAVDPKIHEKVDGWVFHHYGPITGGHTSKMIGCLDAVEKRGASKNIPILVTEDGIGSNNLGALTSTHGWPAGSYETYDKAAASHKKKFEDMRAHPRWGYRLAFWDVWSARDVGVIGQHTDAYWYMGAIRNDYAPKGAYTEFIKQSAAQFS